MIVIVDDRKPVADGFVARLEREGIAALGLSGSECGTWITAVAEADLAAVEAFLIGTRMGCNLERARLCKVIASRSRAVIVAVVEERCLDETLDLFAAGVDDVVRMPVHMKEVLARINAVLRRAKGRIESKKFGDITVFFDGRDPEIGGERIQIPRRERRILEYLCSNIGCRVSKSQIFSAVYGLFNENYDENVIESHISKLRKRLRQRLGYDPIECRRFLGYRLAHPNDRGVTLDESIISSFAQDGSDFLMEDRLQLQE